MEVVVNAAMSADGKLSTRERRQIPISGDDDFDRVDALRASVDAIMVGVGTVLSDDPRLTVKDERREAGRSPNPVRVVADSHARTPPDAALFDGSGEVVVLASEAAPSERVGALASRATVHRVGDTRTDLAAGLDRLHASGVERCMVEGGGEVIFSLFEAGLVDRVLTFVGGTIIGGRDAPTLADGTGFTDPGDFVDLTLNRMERLDDGVLLAWDVEKSA